MQTVGRYLKLLGDMLANFVLHLSVNGELGLRKVLRLVLRLHQTVNIDELLAIAQGARVQIWNWREENSDETNFDYPTNLFSKQRQSSALRIFEYL